MVTTGMTVIEQQYMETFIRQSIRIADDLETANTLKENELCEKKRLRQAIETLADVIRSKQ